MEWTDDAIVLGTRRHGEGGAVLEAMTRAHGRHLGLVRAARSQRSAAALQTGNAVTLTWRARLDEHLGYFLVEPVRMRAAELMGTAIALESAQTLAAHLRLLPERDPHPELHAALEAVIDHLGDPWDAAELVVRFEILVLAALGVGLDLGRCALTGATTDLAWVSPKTGRAATREAGAPYADKLLALPRFLAEDPGSNRAPPTWPELREGFGLTGSFLDRHVWGARNLAAPASRERLIERLARDLEGRARPD